MIYKIYGKQESRTEENNQKRQRKRRKKIIHNLFILHWDLHRSILKDLVELWVCEMMKKKWTSFVKRTRKGKSKISFFYKYLKGHLLLAKGSLCYEVFCERDEMSTVWKRSPKKKYSTSTYQEVDMFKLWLKKLFIFFDVIQRNFLFLSKKYIYLKMKVFSSLFISTTN
jgi:hypothetical protein